MLIIFDIAYIFLYVAFIFTYFKHLLLNELPTFHAYRFSLSLSVWVSVSLLYVLMGLFWCHVCRSCEHMDVRLRDILASGSFCLDFGRCNICLVRIRIEHMHIRYYTAEYIQIHARWYLYNYVSFEHSCGCCSGAFISLSIPPTTQHRPLLDRVGY
jgi:hypothetical protein